MTTVTPKWTPFFAISTRDDDKGYLVVGNTVRLDAGKEVYSILRHVPSDELRDLPADPFVSDEDPLNRVNLVEYELITHSCDGKPWAFSKVEDAVRFAQDIALDTWL